MQIATHSAIINPVTACDKMKKKLESIRFLPDLGLQTSKLNLEARFQLILNSRFSENLLKMKRQLFREHYSPVSC